MFKEIEKVEAVANVTVLYGMCGVNILQNFRSIDVPEERFYVLQHKDYSLKNIAKDILQWNKGGCGWLQVAYITGEKVSKEQQKKQERVYNTLAKRFPVVFESEKRKNLNSGNMFWFVIYDMTKEVK